jgi:8-oxo-dGTP pyrophosphatase MutT (NUDIX family)
MDEEDTNKVSKILILDRGRVLLLMSSKLKKFNLPGGHIKKNETFTQGLKREVLEETGLTVSWSKIIFSKPNFTLFKGGVYQGTVNLSPEHDGFVWAKISEAHRYPLCNYTKRDIYGLQKWWRNVQMKKKRIREEAENN